MSNILFLEEKLIEALENFLKANKTLSHKAEVKIVSLHHKSYIEIDERDIQAFTEGEVWEAGNFILKVVSCEDVDGTCYVTLKEVS